MSHARLKLYMQVPVVNHGESIRIKHHNDIDQMYTYVKFIAVIVPETTQSIFSQ